MTKIEKEYMTPGQRLRHIRSIFHLTRSYLQEKYGLPEVTLKSWENGTTTLSISGAKRCVEAYRNEGIIVSEEWILQGIGLDPKTAISVGHYFTVPTDKDLPIENDEILMIKDAQAFKESHSSAVIMIVSNDDMRPFYWPGDYVGGRLRYGKDIDLLINKDCIVYLQNGEHFFRRLIKNSLGNYNLTCLNPNETTSEPVLYNINIDSAAPVIWHRRKDY